MGKYLLSILFCVLLLPSAVQAKTKYVIDYFKIMVRSQPGDEYKIIDQLSSNEKVRPLATEGDWAKIAFRDNKRPGWVLRRFKPMKRRRRCVSLSLKKSLRRMRKELAVAG